MIFAPPKRGKRTLVETSVGGGGGWFVRAQDYAAAAFCMLRVFACLTLLIYHVSWGAQGVVGLLYILQLHLQSVNGKYLGNPRASALGLCKCSWRKYRRPTQLIVIVGYEIPRICLRYS